MFRQETSVKIGKYAAIAPAEATGLTGGAPNGASMPVSGMPIPAPASGMPIPAPASGMPIPAPASGMPIPAPQAPRRE